MSVLDLEGISAWQADDCLLPQARPPELILLKKFYFRRCRTLLAALGLCMALSSCSAMGLWAVHGPQLMQCYGLCTSQQPSGAMFVWTQPLPPLSPQLTEVIISAEWIEILADRIAPAVPDFKWGASTDGSKDDAGWSLVAVQVSVEIELLPRSAACLCSSAA